MYEEYTDKQIVEMLMPKLEKLGWEPEFGSRMEKLISTLYKSGYIRGQLGRSFIIEEPKQSKRWVPAAKENLEKGVKVRFLNSEKHDRAPQFYPVAGTIGYVTHVCDDETCFVQWNGFYTDWYACWKNFEVLLCE